MYVFLIASAVVSAVLYFGTTFLPVPIPWFVAVGSFFGSLVCCAVVSKRVGRDREQVDSAMDRRVGRRLGRPLLGVALMAFMAGLMMNVAGQEKISLETYQWTAFVIMLALNGLLLLPALLAPRAFSVPRLYKFILPLSALGFLLLPIAWDASGRGMVNSFVQVGFTFTNVIFYCLIAEEYRTGQTSPIKAFSAMQLVVMVANFTGLFLAFFCIGYLEPGGIMLTITASAAVYLILAVTLLLFKDRSLAGGEGESEKEMLANSDVDTTARINSDDTGLGPSRFANLIEYAQLSAREREVLDHLRQGRAPKTIAKLLFVSENTVRFHIRNIYQKFDVHSRIELMELFDDALGGIEGGLRSDGI
ncbi:MAG: helix-turn-helix transcriptional regulator [Raoultibacter sp.]